MARLEFAPTAVLSTTEARGELPSLAERFREQGAAAGVVFFGPHRRAAGAIVPVELLELLAPYLEDIVIAERVTQRLADNQAVASITLDELDQRLGLDSDDVVAATAELRAELGLR